MFDRELFDRKCVGLLDILACLGRLIIYVSKSTAGCFYGRSKCEAIPKCGHLCVADEDDIYIKTAIQVL